MLDDTLFRANLTALRSWTPAVYDLLARTPLPSDWQPTAGTDATPTFSRPGADPLVVEWLGGTSMPRTSAVPLTAALDPNAGDQANALGLSLATGYEWVALTARLAAHQMLFVLETDPALARLALTICDLTPLLASAKVVLLVGAEAAELESQLRVFLAAHPGINPPAVIHPLPSLSAARRQTLLGLAEPLIRAAVIARQAQTQAAATQLATLYAGPRPLIPGPSVLILSLTPAHPFDRILPHLFPTPESAATPTTQDSALRTRHFVLDQHLTAGPLRHLQTILAERPAAILSDLFRGQLTLPLPAALPIYTFIPPTPPPTYWHPDHLPTAATLAACDRIICHSSAHLRLLQARGFPQAQITLIPLAVPAPATGLSADPVPVNHLITNHVITNPTVFLFADLPPLDPAPYGFTLPTHLALWGAAYEILAESGLAAHPDQLPDMFRRTQARASVAVTDAALAGALQHILRHVLLPAVPLITLARQVAAARLPLTLVGTNWPTDIPNAARVFWSAFQAALHTQDSALERFSGDRREGVCHRDTEGTENAQRDEGEKAKLHDGTQDARGTQPTVLRGIALAFSPDGSLHPAILCAAGAGLPIVSPALPNNPWAALPGALPTILRSGLDYLSPSAQQLLPALKALLADTARGQALARSARARLLAHHTWAQRLPLLGLPVTSPPRQSNTD